MPRSQDGGRKGGPQGDVHWIALALGRDGERARAYRAVREAIDAAGGLASKAARLVDPPYPYPAFLRVVLALDLLEYMHEARRRAKAAKSAPPKVPGRAGYWPRQALRGTRAERAAAAEALKRAIVEAEGNVPRAATALGMHEHTLRETLAEYELTWFPLAVRAEVWKKND